MRTRTHYEVGWNDMAHAINTWSRPCDDYPNEDRKAYVERCLSIAQDGNGRTDYHRGCQAACKLFLTGEVEKLAYKGGYVPRT